MNQQIRNILTSLGFIQAKGQLMLYEKQIDDMTAYVDFRKKEHAEKGRRFVKKGDNFDIDPDTITDLVEFKRLRDEALQLSNDNPEGNNREASSGTLGQQQPSTPPPLVQSHGLKQPAAPTSKSVFDEICLAYEIDIAEIFGNSGDGKSQTVMKFASDAMQAGKKVLYIDTERGSRKLDRERLGSSYRCISNMAELMSFAKNIPKDIDLLIIDSVGYPVLTEWAKLGQNEKGQSLTQIIAIKDMLKDWAINNNKVCIVTNQPDSDFGKEKGYVNRPFGDKGQFVIKEVFLIKRVESSLKKTRSVLEVFRSRYDARGTVVANIEITNDGVTIK